MRPRLCGVNRALGGDVFVCRRPLSQEGNGAFCAYHADHPHNGSKLELTWNAWFKAKFLYRPRNIWRALWKIPGRLKWWYRTKDFPQCAAPRCQDKAMYKSGGYCIDHYYDE